MGNRARGGLEREGLGTLLRHGGIGRDGKLKDVTVPDTPGIPALLEFCLHMRLGSGRDGIHPLLKGADRGEDGTMSISWNPMATAEDASNMAALVMSQGHGNYMMAKRLWRAWGSTVSLPLEAAFMWEDALNKRPGVLRDEILVPWANEISKALAAEVTVGDDRSGRGGRISAFTFRVGPPPLALLPEDGSEVFDSPGIHRRIAVYQRLAMLTAPLPGDAGGSSRDQPAGALHTAVLRLQERYRHDPGMSGWIGQHMLLGKPGRARPGEMEWVLKLECGLFQMAAGAGQAGVFADGWAEILNDVVLLDGFLDTEEGQTAFLLRLMGTMLDSRAAIARVLDLVSDHIPSSWEIARGVDRMSEIAGAPERDGQTLSRIAAEAFPGAEWVEDVAMAENGGIHLGTMLSFLGKEIVSSQVDDMISRLGS